MDSMFAITSATIQVHVSIELPVTYNDLDWKIVETEQSSSTGTHSSVWKSPILVIFVAYYTLVW